MHQFLSSISDVSLLEDVIENLPVGVFAKDATDDFKFVIWNREIENIFSNSRTDMLGKNDYDFFEKEEADYYRKCDLEVMGQNKVVDIPMEEVTTLKGVIKAHTIKVPVTLKNGKKLLVGILNDITELEEAKKKLLEYSENLEHMVDDKTKELQEKNEITQKLNRELEESEQELQLINENLEIRIKEEVEKSREKDKTIFEQSKMAALGELIGNIAHQWRQPLTVISTSASGLQLQSNMNILNKDSLKQQCKSINENAQYLSKIIDDFRNFIRGESIPKEFNLKESIESFISLISNKSDNIKIHTSISGDIKIYGLHNELNQCLINLFNNSKDAFTNNNIKDRHIIISASIIDNKVEIIFYDNGGGIDNAIIDKIFEPYFTTKHQSVGTGLGLNMTYKFITERMDGSITVENDTFFIDDKEYFGAKFIITIPMEKK